MVLPAASEVPIKTYMYICMVNTHECQYYVNSQMTLQYTTTLHSAMNLVYHLCDTPYVARACVAMTEAILLSLFHPWPMEPESDYWMLLSTSLYILYTMDEVIVARTIFAAHMVILKVKNRQLEDVLIRMDPPRVPLALMQELQAHTYIPALLAE